MRLMLGLGLLVLAVVSVGLLLLAVLHPDP